MAWSEVRATFSRPPILVLKSCFESIGIHPPVGVFTTGLSPWRGWGIIKDQVFIIPVPSMKDLDLL
jgi:hypothetical protein